MPITTLSGVRISWLICVRNSVFARLAESASALRRLMFSSVRLRSVMSRADA